MKRRILSALLALSMVLTLLPGMALAADSESAAPPSGPTIDVDNDLYQVVVMCDEDSAHYWSYPKKHNWGTTDAQFEVGTPRANDLNNGTEEQYPYICPVTPAYTLEQCLSNINGEDTGHRLVTTEATIPVAYYYWNETDGWQLLRDKQPDPNVTFNQANNKHEGTLTVHVTCAEEPDISEPDDSDKPASKPVVKEADLYQVEVVCQEKGENPTHWWSSPNQTTWAWVDEFAVGEIEANTVYQPDTYPWRCPVTPKESLETYLGKINSKLGEAHQLVTKELPVAYYYYNSSTNSWEFVKNTAANPNCTVSTDGKNTWYLSIEVTCANGGGTPVEPETPPSTDGPVWLTNMNIAGFDLFTKAPKMMPETADGKYLILATSHVEGDTDVYALYLNSTPCAPNNGVIAGQGVCAVKLGYDENGDLAGYLGDAKEKIALSELLMTVEAVEGGYSISNGGKYLSIGSLMVGNSATALIIGTQNESGAYSITGGRTLTLYVNGKHTAGGATWTLTNFWGPGTAPGKSGSGSSYIYFFHTHVDDGKTVAAFDSEGNEIANVGGSFTIPTGGYIKVEEKVTFTVPELVQSITLPASYASSLLMNEDGGFNVMGCVITMQDGTTTSSITRSGSAGSGVTFARTADNRLYFAGEGAMTDYSSRNTDVPVWLDSMGDRTLKSVYIGEGITSVGANAFKFTSLSSVTLCEGLESIGDSAFESCRIESIEIPATVELIGANAFKGCTELTRVDVPASVVSIGSNAFANCPRLRTVTFAGDLGSIPNGAFQAISGHGQLNLVFQAGTPASAYTDYEGMLPFLHQNGAIVYTNTAPSTSLVQSGGADAYFAVLNGASLSGVELKSGVLPVLPAMNGVAFTGWQLGDTSAALPGGSAVSGQPAGTVFTARWGGEYTVACTVTIDGVGYTVAQGKTMGEQMPTDPVREGWRFTGWVDANQEPFTADTIITGNTVVTSTWTAIPLYTVTFDTAGGVLAGQNTITIYEGEKLTLFQIPNVVREGYTFDGWFTADGSRFQSATVSSDMTLTAQWTPEGQEPPVPTNPGTSSPAAPVTPVTPVAPAPSNPPEEIEDIDDPDTPPLGELPVPSFVDVAQDAWYAEVVASVYMQGLMEGVSTQIFAPKMTLTRGMMAQIIYNAASKPETTASVPFADVQGSYYSDAVAWGADNGVILGLSDTTFGGEKAVTREQMAVMLYRYAQTQVSVEEIDLTVLDRFQDSDQVSGWAQEAMAWAVQNGLLQGRGNDMLAPRANSTRAEAAAVLDRYAKLFLA